MEEEPIMCKRNLRLLVSLCTIVTFAFSNVTLTLQSNGNLDYDSDSDIYGFQFSQNGCVTGASGGDADAAGFTVSVGNNVLGFSFSGSFVPAGSGTLTELEGDLSYDCLSNFVVSGAGGTGLEVTYLEGEDTADDGGGGDCVDMGAGDFTCEQLFAFGATCDQSLDMFGLDGTVADFCAASCQTCSTGPVYGCMDPEAVNYDSDATEAEDNCLYCPDVDVCMGLGDEGEFYYSSGSDIYGFQFDTGGCTTDISGGDAETAGFTVSGGDGQTVLGFSFSGSFIPAGDGTLVYLTGDYDQTCFSNFIFSGVLDSM